MKVFDLHCDTLYRAVDENKSIIENDFDISILKGLKYEPWAQCFAIFIPDEYRGEDALTLFKKCKRRLDFEIDRNKDLICKCDSKDDIKKIVRDKRCNAILTVEGGAVLAGKLSNLDYLKECGVKMITLTWNGECEIGGGAKTSNLGITEFGTKVVRHMEELSMIIDVSHASDRLFYDVANIVKRPIVASHSNSRSICSHKRNLTDEQFKFISSNGGIVGLNFASDFLNDKTLASPYDIIKHADHFLSLGGERSLCLGTDFDGADIPDDILGIEWLKILYELFLQHNYSQSLVDNIFFNNAYDFFCNFV
mgnify:CR=1 FL=1